MLDRIKDLFDENIQTQIASTKLLSEPLQQAVIKLKNCLLQGGKVVICGTARSYANAQILLVNLLNRYEIERPSYPSVLLSMEGALGSTLIADNRLNKFYQRQFNSIAQKGDILILLAPDGRDQILLNIIDCAISKELDIITLTGLNNEQIKGLLNDTDVEIKSPALKESRILENHLFIINALCELLDQQLLGL